VVIHAQRIEFIVEFEPTAHVVNESTSCRTGHDRATVREDFATKLGYFIGKKLTRAFSRQGTNVTSGFDTEVETAGFRHSIQHVASSIDQLRSTAFPPQNSDNERPHVWSPVNPLDNM